MQQDLKVVRRVLETYADIGDLNLEFDRPSNGAGRDNEGAHSGRLTIKVAGLEFATLRILDLKTLLEALDASDEVRVQANRQRGRLSFYVHYLDKKLTVRYVD